MPMQIYISHAAADKDLARQIADSLKDSGFEVWDESQVLPGDNWGAKLGKALEESDGMVVLLTPYSLQSPYLRFDLSYALGSKDYKGRVVSVVTASPDELPRSQIPWVLSKLPMINLAEVGTEEGFRRIARALQGAA
jgi:hypothetical protein